MSTEATLRIPAALMARLRERSQQEGRSLDETAWLALERGLGAVGSAVEVTPASRYDPAEIRGIQIGLNTEGMPRPHDVDV